MKPPKMKYCLPNLTTKKYLRWSIVGQRYVLVVKLKNKQKNNYVDNPSIQKLNFPSIITYIFIIYH